MQEAIAKESFRYIVPTYAAANFAQDSLTSSLLPVEAVLRTLKLNCAGPNIRSSPDRVAIEWRRVTQLRTRRLKALPLPSVRKILPFQSLVIRTRIIHRSRRSKR